MKVINKVSSLTTHSWKKYSKRDLRKVKRIVVHHFAGNISIEEAAAYHVSKGWPGIGYHYVIDFDGTIYLTNNIDTVAYNVGNNNTPTIGVALRGNWSMQLPDSCMLVSLQDLIESLRLVMGHLPVYGHDDFRNTECPGLELKRFLVRAYGPQPQPMKIKISKIRKFFNKLFGTDKHTE